MSHPPSSYGIWLYCDCDPPTVSLCLLLCLCMSGIFFGEFQCLPVNDCSAVSCDSGALARGCECTSFYSAILNQSPTLYILNKVWYKLTLDAPCSCQSEFSNQGLYPSLVVFLSLLFCYKSSAILYFDVCHFVLQFICLHVSYSRLLFLCGRDS